MVTPPLVRSLRLIDPRHKLISMVRDIREALEEMNNEGIMIRITNTLHSMLLATTLVKAVKTSQIKAIYFNVKMRYSMPRKLKRLVDYLGIKYEYIEIGSLTSSIKRYTQGYTEIEMNEIIDTVSTLILKEISQQENLMLVGETDKTQWMTGTFNIIYSKCMDLLPLTHLYSSQLNKIAAELHILTYARESDKPGYIQKLKKELGDIEIEIIDSILLGIGINKTDEEIHHELNKTIPIETIKKIRNLVNNGYYKRNCPIVSP